MSLRLRLFLATFGGVWAGLFGGVLGVLLWVRGPEVPMVICAGGVAVSLLLCLVVSWGVARQFTPRATEVAPPPLPRVATYW